MSMCTGDFGKWSEFVYAILDIDRKIRYVGRTTNRLNVRLNQHRSQCKKGTMPFHKWLKTDPYVTIELLEVCPYQKRHAGEAEADWIRWLRCKGHPIMNVAPYDDGLSPSQRKTLKEMES
ncbi:hypothetical protein QYF36_001701 [Acer negundo]|nr:hypothetical protein QYF36_001701 [Acer negundo]